MFFFFLILYRKSLNPTWNETFKYDLPKGQPCSVFIKVWDKDKVGRNDPLGHTTIDCEAGIDFEGFLELFGAKTGEVCSVFSFFWSVMPVLQVQFPFPTRSGSRNIQVKTGNCPESKRRIFPGCGIGRSAN